ncbi:MAG: hypothetical protein JWL61_2459 [Gemmatimonadetes bacterium]|nr:hypothetical protein [Gemmatimonadota bacterium]
MRLTRGNGAKGRDEVESHFPVEQRAFFTSTTIRPAPRTASAGLFAVLGVITAPMIAPVTLLGILVATSSILFEDRLPLVSAGGFSVHIPDIMLLGLLGLVGLQWLVVPGYRIVRTRLDRPLLVFYCVTLLSTFVAIAQSSVDIHDAMRATRVFSYYLTFFAVTNLVRDRRQLLFLLNGIFFLASVVAIAMIAQYVLGNSVELLPGRVEALETQGRTFDAVTRIAPPGFSVVVVSFVTILSIWACEKFSSRGLLRFCQSGLMGAALLLTFLRSYWTALIIGVFVLMVLLKGPSRRRLVGWGLAIIFSAALLLLVVFNAPDSRASNFLAASWDRFSTLGSSGTFQGQDGSVDWRRIEAGYAFSAIESSPLIGLGMGAAYRPVDLRIDWRDAGGFHVLTRHIHNGHLWILLQSGLLGYLSFVWLSLLFLLRGFKNWRGVSDNRMRGVVLGFTVVYLVVVIAAGANSSFMQWGWTPVFGILLGVNELILRNYRSSEAAGPEGMRVGL